MRHATESIHASTVEQQNVPEQLLILPALENVTSAVLHDVKTIYDRSHEIVMSSVEKEVVWVQKEVMWVQKELEALFHRLEHLLEPYLPDWTLAQDAMQPYVHHIQEVQTVIQQYIPEIQDQETRELVVIALVSILLSLWTVFFFRNHRHHRRHRRPKRLQARSTYNNNNMPLLNNGSNHSRDRSLNSNNSKNSMMHHRMPSRPSLHRGTDDSQMSSKDGGAGGSLRSRLTSFDMSFRRRRLTSLDPYWGADHDLFVDQETTPQESDSSSLYYEEEFDLSSMTYFGPTESKLRYAAWTPPPTWAEASRRVIPQDATRSNLQRQIIVDVGKAANLKVVEGLNATATSSSMSLPISEWSVHVRTPVEGGVLELYVKNTPKEDWLELTFTSAHSCAQFQLDLLAYQVFGSTLTSLYQALEIVHQGSAAHPGQEFVLHDMKHGNEPVTTTAGGVAWDDAMRALNSLPSIRLSLERLLVAQRQSLLGRPRINSEPSVTTPTTPKTAADASVAATSTTPATPAPPKAALSLTDDYLEKRLLLGPVDFFRLFVPTLPQSSMPQSTNSETRVQHLLRWRKRLARAAILVQAYVRARILVNQGWNLRNTLPEPYLVRRLAYDDNEENQQRDLISKNEYYEAIVSRDVRCGVRTVEKSKLLTNGTTTTVTTTAQRHVLYQAYTLVGCHVFRLPKPDRWHKHSLRPNRDPIEALPSLRALISSHPEQEFMVNAFFCEGIRIAMVQVYARSLPKGIDPKFDAVMKRYTEGCKETRDSMLQALVYLGQNTSQSFSSWIALRVLFYLLSWTRRCRLQALPRPTMSSDYFLSLPSVNVSNFAETFHYGGGAMNETTTDGNLPTNYVAMSAHIDSRHMPNLLARMVHSQIERGVLADSTVDFTLILESNQMDELPERALSTIRMVHFSPTEVALPVAYSNVNNDAALQGEPEMKILSDPKTWILNPWAFWHFVKMLFVAALRRFVSLFVSRSIKSDASAADSRLLSPSSIVRSVYLSPCETDIMEDTDDVRAAEDEVETAVTTIVDILAELKVPVRKAGLSEEELAKSEPIPKSFEWVQLPPGMHREDFTSVNVLYRSTRSDVKRFLVASEGDVYTAAVRLAESITWRSFTFPVDVKSCRIELQSGQFFQQGRDRDGNPVFYFRNMCLGPWRKDEDAAIAAVLHRLENSLKGFYPSVKCTVIILMRRPYTDKRNKKEVADSSVSSVSGRITEEGEMGENEGDDHGPQGDDDEDENENDRDDMIAEPDHPSNIHTGLNLTANPRLPADERYYLHTNASLIRKLVEVLMQHYPERLSRVLIVPSIGNVAYFRSVVGGRLALASVVGSVRTRNKVRFLKHFNDLKIYVKTDDLATIVGGTAPIDPAVYEAR